MFPSIIMKIDCISYMQDYTDIYAIAIQITTNNLMSAKENMQCYSFNAG